jgi:hypothetical protein
MAKPAAPVQASTSINIDREVWKEFKARCAGQEKTVTAQLQRLIVNWLKLHGDSAVRRQATK